MQVCFTNLGCKLNQAELERLARDFSRAGYRVTRNLASADLHVVNTCTVTHVAARDSRKLARRGRRLNPTIRTVLTGCYVAEAEDRAAQATGADLIVPNRDKERLLDAVHEAFPDLALSRPAAPTDRPYAPVEFGNARALVKIEDGCNMRCAFCIIPSTRGMQRSRPPKEILAETRDLAEAGFREIVLTGVQISSYRWQGTGLYELVQRLSSEISTGRFRLTSIAPWQFDARLLDLFESGRLCRHLHLSLQSGCTATLERMRRPYTADAFAELVAGVRRRVPGIAITTDVIVGFPGETVAEFETSRNLIRDLQFARVHVFPYSARPGTEAAELAAPIAPVLKKERVQDVLALAAESECAFVDQQLGHPSEVLWEAQRQGIWHGTTDNYVRVRTRSTADLTRRLTRSVLAARRGSAAWTTLPAPATGTTVPVAREGGLHGA